MSSRTDLASRLIPASAERLYQAFAAPGALERWLPPEGMDGEMLHFDFRAGGSYRMRLSYREHAPGQGKSAGDADAVEVRLTRIEPARLIEQEVRFDSDDPAFDGTMRMTWTFDREGSGTRVTIRAENVPAGIAPADHQAGMDSSLENLARFVATGPVSPAPPAPAS